MESERETRRRRIDPRLEAAGWPVATAPKPAPETSPLPAALPELATLDGPADYALCAEQRVQAVVEAKKLTVGPQGVLSQAERYSRGIQQQPRWQGEYGVPFLYSTNGEQICFHDVRRELQPLALGRGLPHPGGAGGDAGHATSTPSWRPSTSSCLNPGLRPYQVEANAAIEQADPRAASASCW